MYLKRDPEKETLLDVHMADGFDVRRQRRRRTFAKVTAVLACFLLFQAYLIAFPRTIICRFPLQPHYDLRADEILKNNPLIDGHDDLLITLRVAYKNHIYDTDFQERFENGSLVGQLDVPRIKQGQLGGSFWSAFVPCPANGSDFSDENYAPYVRATIEQIDLFHRLASLYPKYFTLTPNAASAQTAFEAGYLISPLAIEGLHQIGNSISTLRQFYSMGVRYATLTWNCHNRYADAAVVADVDEPGKSVASKPLWHGVSPDHGRKLIHEMNRLGMLVDLSHVSADTMRDVLYGHHDTSQEPAWQGSLAPPIFSHSSVRAICPHPRNVPDDVLKLVARRRGIVMINFAPEFIACEVDPDGGEYDLPRPVPKNATLEQVVRHIMYVGELIGYDYVGIGSDYDGITSLPKGLEGVDKFPDLVAALLRHGVSDEDAAKIVGRNLLRVWAEADRVSEQLKREGRVPLEDL